MNGFKAKIEQLKIDIKNAEINAKNWGDTVGMVQELKLRLELTEQEYKQYQG